MIKALLQRLRPLQGAPEPALPAEELHNLEEMRELIRVLTIRNKGLRMKLRTVQEQAKELKRRWPLIHKQVFPSPDYIQRK